MKTRPITRAQAKRFNDNLARFIQGLINSQKDMSISEDSKPILSIQVVEAGMDPGSGFSAFMESEPCEMAPMIHGFNTYV